MVSAAKGRPSTIWVWQLRGDGCARASEIWSKYDGTGIGQQSAGTADSVLCEWCYAE